MRDHHTLCDLGAMSENHPDYGPLIRVLINGFDVSWGDMERGGQFIVHTLRGFAMRHHFDRYHPDQVELGVRAAPPAGLEHDAWMFGYRFVERKEPSGA